MSKRRASIYQRIILFQIISIILIMSVYGFISYRTNLSKEIRLMEEETDRVMQRLASQLSLPFWNLDNTSVQNLLFQEMKNPYLSGIAVFQKGQIWAGTIVTDTGDILTIDGHNITSNLQRVPDRQGPKETIIYKDRKGKTWELGELVLYTTDKTIKSSLRSLLFQTILQSFLLIITLSIFTIIVLNFLLHKPLNRITSTARRIGEGEIELQAQVSGPREIATLASSFNTMTQRLRESLYELDQYFTNAPELLCICGIDGIFRRLNKEWNATLGYSLKELEGRNFYDFVHPDDQESTLAEQNRLRANKIVRNFVNRYRHKDGSYRWIEWRSFPAGELIYAAATDITERRKAEEALRESEEKYRLLVQNASDAIFIAQDDVLKFPNPATVQMTGYSAAELSEMPFIQFIHPEDREMVIQNYMKRLRGEHLPHTYPFRIIDRKQETRWVQLNAVLTTWEGRPATLNFLRDITDQRNMEAQFQGAQRLESLGTLAGGIAHDFNNVLMGIQGRTSLMLLDMDPGHRHFGHLKEIEEHVKSAADLTRQLLGFARGGKYEVRPADLNEIVRKTSSLFARTKKEIRLNEKYQKGIWPVEIDQGQIEQVLMNLYVNAWHAMPGGGDLFLETFNVVLDDTDVSIFGVKSGKYVKLTITDTGEGMDEKTMARIFEPFFTTKEMGRGSGLGLATVYGIIKNHGGIINVSSERGHGSTFRVYLPATGKNLVRTKEFQQETLIKGTETILLVDDETSIAEVGNLMLKNLGYKVMVAHGGGEALEVYRSNRGHIDLVILDMIMPDLGGGQVYEQLKEINPEVKVLLSSGYSINGLAQKILDSGCRGFIQKPFNMKELSARLREILNME